MWAKVGLVAIGCALGCAAGYVFGGWLDGVIEEGNKSECSDEDDVLENDGDPSETPA